MSTQRTVAIFVLLSALLLIPTAQAVIPDLLSYQARLLDSRGAPLEGNYDLDFNLYDAEIDGKLLWGESQNLGIADGVLDVMLGRVEPLNPEAFDAEELWLEVHVPEIGFSFPRVRVTPTGFAFRVKSLEGSVGGNITGPTSVDGPLTVVGTVTTNQSLTVGGDLNLPDGVQLVGANGGLTIISGASTITLDPDGTITISGPHDLTLEAAGDLNLEGTNVNITAAGQCKIDGASGTELTSGGTTKVAGSLVTIN